VTYLLLQFVTRCDKSRYSIFVEVVDAISANLVLRICCLFIIRKGWRGPVPLREIADSWWCLATFLGKYTFLSKHFFELLGDPNDEGTTFFDNWCSDVFQLDHQEWLDNSLQPWNQIFMNILSQFAIGRMVEKCFWIINVRFLAGMFKEVLFLLLIL